MAQDNLGLFDTPPGRQEIRLGVSLVALIFIALLAFFPARNVFVGPVNGFIPTITSAMIVCDLITAAILYAQAAVFRSRALTMLASGFAFTGLLYIPYGLTYPGAFSASGLLGARVNTTGWIAVCWRLAAPIAVILYAWLKRADAARPIMERPSPRISLGVLGAIALALLVALLTTVGHDLLPSFFVNQSEVIQSRLVAANVVAISLVMAAMVMLFRQQRSVLDLWLLVAMSAWLVQSLLNMPLISRFSLGAYIFLTLAFFSNFIVMLALIAESTRLYARLALATAERERERETRLMSMDAVAAAIAHEVGQPLAAISLNTAAGLEYLNADQPLPVKAAQAMRDTQDAARRAFDVVKSVRAMFSKGMGIRNQIDLNDLALETTWLLDREIKSHKVNLELDFDPDLPSIEANRVQIQRILINLITNSLDALRQSRRRVRNVTIRTARTGGHNVLLQVSDTGVGIPADKLTQIFEPFITTKKSGTGLGLSLCRTIVEEHGGRLWATPGEAHGVTFHLQIPSSREAAGQATAL